MSAKQQILAAIDALPDSLSLEEAIERLCRAFKIEQAQVSQGSAGEAELKAALQQGEADVSAGRVKSHEDVSAKYRHLLDGES